ncbi:MAG: sensor histidine kinase, partial [Rhodothermaceae bacterium]
FFSIIAHDLKSPLQSLLGNIQFLSDEFDEMEKSEGKIFINNVFKSTKTLYSLIENLLEWSRIQLGKLELNFEIFMIDDLIKKIALQIENLAAVKNINIDIVIKSKPRLIGDKNIIEIILRNILSNAIKFSYEESKIEVIYLVKNKIVKMSVRDFGTGIPEENIKKLFSDTETVTTHGTKNEKGTGLGLILCKELLEKFNGKISVTSKENEGSVFTIEFPFLESIKDLETE